MRSLNKNKRQIYYALLTGETVNTDEYGNETGESSPVYGEPVELNVNISASSGEESVQVFGSLTEYNRTMYGADNDCPIDEDSIIWFNVSTTEPHNYIVVSKADSKNGILYALREVTVT
jgi:hypothetical protein